MNIYSNGCSHTAGHLSPRGHSHIKFTSYQIMGDYKLIDVDIPFKSPKFNYNKHFLNNEGNKLFFEASNGKSNDLIFFETYNFINNSLKNNIKIDYVVIQWSGANRTFYTLPNGGIDNINLFDNTHLGIKFEPMASLQTIQYMHILQELFDKNNIEYAFIPYMELDSKSFNKFDLSKSLDLSRFTEHPTKGHLNYFLKNKEFICDEQGHPSNKGSYYISKLTLNILNKSECIVEFNDIPWCVEKIF